MMLLISLITGIAVLASVLAGWAFLGPEGLRAQSKRLKERIFASEIFRYFEPQTLEKTRHLSDISTFRNFLSRHPFSDEIFKLLKRANIKISVSLFLLSCLALGAFAFLYLQFLMPKLFASLAATSWSSVQV